MYREAVSSRNLVSVGYDPSPQTLEVEFQHGGVYQYFGVPEHLYLGLMSTSSHGQYFDAHVKKGGFAYVRVG